MRINDFITEELEPGQIKILLHRFEDNDAATPQSILNHISKDTEIMNKAQEVALQMKISTVTYLDQYHHSRPMYRGVKNSLGWIYEGRSHELRKNKDSNPEAVELFNEFATDLGFKANRSNSIFAIGSKNIASDYGKPFVILPKNSAVFTWSANPRFKDTILSMDTFRYAGVITYALDDDAPLADELMWLNREIKKTVVPPPGDKSESAIRYSELEKMKNICASSLEWPGSIKQAKLLYGPWINIHFPGSVMLDDELTRVTTRTDLDEFKKLFQLSNTRLTDAINSEHEIMVHGEYYAIDWRVWEVFLKLNLFRY